MEDKLYTIREIAEEVNVSKPTVVNAIKALKLKESRRNDRTRTLYYDSKVKEAIIVYLNPSNAPSAEAPNEQNAPSAEAQNAHIEQNAPKEEAQNAPKAPKEEASSSTYIIELLRDQLSQKDKQLEEKDRQIERLQKSLQDALQITKQQQYLSAADLSEKQQTEGKDIIDLKPEVEKQPEQKKKRSLFQRIFNRN